MSLNFHQRKNHLCEFLQIFITDSDTGDAPSHFALHLHACGSIAWVLVSLFMLSAGLDGSQFSGGASNDEERDAGKDGCFFHLPYLCLLWLIQNSQTPRRLSSAKSTKYLHGYLSLNWRTSWVYPQRTCHTGLLQSPSESIRNPQAFWSGLDRRQHTRA